MLENCTQYDLPEAGCDEAGRGCLAGAVFAAAVILPPDFSDPLLDDSKRMTERNRDRLRLVIEREAVAWAVEAVSAARIDEINILNASFEGMSLAVARLDPAPQLLAIDGNRFRTNLGIPYRCIVKGDGKYADIAAASVLAKTHRDEYMRRLDAEYPQYGWAKRVIRRARTVWQFADTVFRPITGSRSITKPTRWNSHSKTPYNY